VEADLCRSLALQRDFYWAENMVGPGLAGHEDQYEALLSRVGTRGEMNDVIGQAHRRAGHQPHLRLRRRQRVHAA
jgi:hypothetical protein